MKKFIIFLTILTNFCSLKASLSKENDDFVELSKYRALEFRLSQVEGSEKFYKSQASEMQKSLTSTGDILLGVQAEHKKLQLQNQRLLEENETLSLRPQTSVYEQVTLRVSELDEENKSLLALQEQWELEKAELQKKIREQDSITEDAESSSDLDSSSSSPLIPNQNENTNGCWYGLKQTINGIRDMFSGIISGNYCGAGPYTWCDSPS